MIPDDGSGPDLTPKQSAVLTHLLAGLGVEQAAKAAGVGERTVWTWLRDNEPFKRELRLRQRQAMDGATSKLQSISSKAIGALERVLDDHAASPSAVVAAARAVLDAGYRGVEVGDLALRVEELEASALPRKRAGGGT